MQQTSASTSHCDATTAFTRSWRASQPRNNRPGISARQSLCGGSRQAQRIVRLQAGSFQLELAARRIGSWRRFIDRLSPFRFRDIFTVSSHRNRLNTRLLAFVHKLIALTPTTAINTMFHVKHNANTNNHNGNACLLTATIFQTLLSINQNALKSHTF